MEFDIYNFWIIFAMHLFAIWIYKRRQRMGLLRNYGIPGPTPNLFSGNYSTLPKDNVPNDSKLIKEFGPIVGYFVGAKAFVLISDVGLIKRIQGKDQQNFLDRPRKVPGGITADKKRGLMLGNLPVDAWNTLRKTISPAFSPDKLKKMAPNIFTLIGIFFGKISTSKETDFYPLFQTLSLDIIGATAFGVHLGIQEDPDSPFHRAIQAEFLQSPDSTLDKLHLRFPEASFIFQNLRLLQNWLKEVCGKSKTSALWEKAKQVLDLRKREQNSERFDLLYHLMGAEFPDDLIIANSVLFFEAAYETMSSSLAFITHLLVKHPEVQDRLREELLASEQLSFQNYASVSNLEYLEAIIYEGLRLFPPQTTFIGRCPKNDFQYTTSGGKSIKIPKGAHVQIALLQIHRSPEIWNQPNEFLPDRWLGKEGKLLKRSVQFQAFGAGKRECIGKKFSLVALKMILANLFQKFQLVPSEGTLHDLAIKFKIATMTPEDSVFSKAIKI